MEPWKEHFEKARKMVIFISKIKLDITLANEVSFHNSEWVLIELDTA